MSTNISDLPYNQPAELPSKDIPRETINHVTDAQVTATYMPPPPPPPPPIKVETPEWTEEAKLPLMLSLLFYIFNTAMVNTTILKMFPNFFQTDGNITVNGTVFKSLLFGCAYYAIMKFVL
jgi:hypothetical protein